MEFLQNLLMPFCVVIITVVGLIKKVPVFDIFIKGAKKSLQQIADLLPALTALSVAVTLLLNSGGCEILTSLLSPLAGILHIPKEVLPLCIITPLSGSGSIAVLESLFESYSPDSYIGRLASVIAGASETTFYAVAVYFSSVGITKTRHTIPSALAADFTSYIAAAFFCKIF